MREKELANQLSPWILASRPKTLSAAIAPVIVGTAVAISERSFHAGAAFAALLAAIFIQIGTNMYNDVADFERGTDTSDRLGPKRVTQSGLLSSRQVRTGAFLSFGMATLCGFYLIGVAGWPVIAIGVMSILAGFAYTAGPYPLAYNGFGDLFVLIFFGFVAVCGTAYVQVGSVPVIAWPAALGIGSIITSLLVVNTIRDMATDEAAGRRTIPVVFGRKIGLAEYGSLLVVAYSICLAMIAFDLGAWPVLLPWITIPFAVRLYRYIAGVEGRALNWALATTAKLVLVYGTLLAAGIILSSLYPTS